MPVAQSVEQNPVKVEVVGSSPTRYANMESCQSGLSFLFAKQVYVLNVPQVQILYSPPNMNRVLELGKQSLRDGTKRNKPIRTELSDSQLSGRISSLWVRVPSRFTAICAAQEETVLYLVFVQSQVICVL
ncbi:hypothetical protein [Bacillus phage BC-T25]|nr:hypothetical protein [Bacillus phage BC-T25]